ncbi:MAG TPA: RNB domain-containing ribonuclease [Rhodanobacteraceae bacterium]|nr:RNB domain-containing ribonuclease [Rhodanobacteraceae bacterium]
MSTSRRIRVRHGRDPRIDAGIAAIRREQELPDAFPAEVEQAAERAAAAPRLPELDRTDIPFITIDPPEAMDLDQAMYVERQGTGYRVHYAIADVAAFVQAGDPVDVEARRRGETLYGADSKIPLHPRPLSEAAASLLPDQLRPALLWTIDLDASGEGIAVDVRRARVRSRAKLNYTGVQADIDAGKAEPMWAVLREIGELREQREQARGGISLPLPEQEIAVDEQGKWTLEFRGRDAVEGWNEQISLLTGMAAAHLMIEHKVGILRTLPKPEAWAIERLHRAARALDIDWPHGLDYPAFIRRLDPAKPAHIAMMIDATSVLRGAGYVAFNGNVPADCEHSALASTYAHTTAPLRRLVDRFVGETCVALCASEPVPAWVLEALPSLPDLMRESGRRASRYEHAVLDLAEAMALSSRVGEVFDASVVDVGKDDPRRGEVIVRAVAVESRIEADRPLPLGERIRARLVEADPVKRRTRFELV